MTALLQDLRDALRSTLKRPGFAALVVGVLGAGLACVIFMLTLLDGFILRPLPFAKPDELLQAGFHGDGGLGDIFPVDSRDLAQIRRYVATKADAAAVARSTINLSDIDRPERYHGGHVTANLFRVLGVAPILGRDFSDDDAKSGAAATAMLSYSLWQARYGGDPSIAGRAIRVGGREATVIESSGRFGRALGADRRGRARDHRSDAPCAAHRSGRRAAAQMSYRENR